ncbi:MAG TPA: hypothetical protein VK736_04800 [Candidatus Binatia bacterium]|nr:hypothetical protein [Candidatus Binatia bacterium]
MSTDRDVTRSVRSWLREDRHEDADRVLDSVLDQLDTTPQRRAGWLARRIPLMNNNIVRFGIAAAAVVLAVVLGITLLGPNVGGELEPTATPTPSAAVSPKALPVAENVALSPGAYSLGAGFPVGITFEVPAGWVSCSSGPVEQGACQSASNQVPGVGVAFTIIDNVVADPCGTNGALLDPPVGPSVDDLVTAISNLEGFEATAAMDVNVDGFDGRRFTMTAPGDAGACELKTWATEDRTNGVGAGEVHEMRILDVGGVRVVISGVYFPSSVSEEQLSALQQVIASIQIEP